MAFDLDGRAKAINSLTAILHNKESFPKETLEATNVALAGLLADFADPNVRGEPQPEEFKLPTPPWSNVSICWEPNRAHYVGLIGPGNNDEDRRYSIIVDNVDLGLRFTEKTEAALAEAAIVAAFNRLGVLVNVREIVTPEEHIQIAAQMATFIASGGVPAVD